MPISINEAHVGKGSSSDLFLSVQFARVGKVKGESCTDGHVDDIELLSWHWGAQSSSALGSTAATARRQYRPLVITKGIDASSVGLLSALAKNDEITEAKLTMRKAGGEALDYYKLKVAGGRVVDIAYDVDATGRPVERVTLNFSRFEVEYKRQQGSGSGSGGMAFGDDVAATS
jgi:type VI secretion system secreted protein Hcp